MFNVCVVTCAAKILLQFISNVTRSSMDKPYEQPTTSEISTSILNFQGPILTMRAFTQTGPRKLRKVALEEFKHGSKELNALFVKTLEHKETNRFHQERPCCHTLGKH